MTDADHADLSRRTSIRLHVEVFAGTTVERAASDMIALANQTGVLVVADFNGVKLWARAGNDPKAIAAAYDVEIQKPAHLYRIAQDRITPTAAEAVARSVPAGGEG